jgi:hypothetical protein
VEEAGQLAGKAQRPAGIRRRTSQKEESVDQLSGPAPRRWNPDAGSRPNDDQLVCVNGVE